jgi:hypothetical protein
MDFKEQCCVVSETPGVTQGCVHARRDLSGLKRFGVLPTLATPVNVVIKPF